MGVSPWHRESCGPGRKYLLAAEVNTKYENVDEIVKKIKTELSNHIVIDSAVRLTIDSAISNGERTVSAISA